MLQKLSVSPIASVFRTRRLFPQVRESPIELLFMGYPEIIWPAGNRHRLYTVLR